MTEKKKETPKKEKKPQGQIDQEAVEKDFAACVKATEGK